jgi:hypothetical protein
MKVVFSRLALEWSNRWYSLSQFFEGIGDGFAAVSEFSGAATYFHSLARRCQGRHIAAKVRWRRNSGHL